MERPTADVEPGDVFQITDLDWQPGWAGAFVMVSEVRAWGVIAFLHCVKSRDEKSQAYIRRESNSSGRRLWFRRVWHRSNNPPLCSRRGTPLTTLECIPCFPR